MNTYQILTWVLGLLLVGSIILNFKECNLPLTLTKADSTIIQGPTTTITKDSVTIRQQATVILQTQDQVKALEDSVERLSYALTGVQPSYLVRYKDTLHLHDTILFTQFLHDSTLIDSLFKASNTKDLLLRNFMPVPRDFFDSNEFFNIKGTVTRSSVNLRSVSIPNTTSVIIGQKQGLFNTGPVTVNIVESNPLLAPGAMQSYQYQPKERKWSIVVGPSILFNGKAFSEGVAITGGYKVF